MAFMFPGPLKTILSHHLTPHLSESHQNGQVGAGSVLKDPNTLRLRILTSKFLSSPRGQEFPTKGREAGQKKPQTGSRARAPIPACGRPATEAFLHLSQSLFSHLYNGGTETYFDKGSEYSIKY